MTPHGATPQGTPNWVDCATTDLDAAEQFYGAVLGWTAERVTGSDGSAYSIQRLDGKMVAGIYALAEEMRRMGVPPHWGTYIEVDDVDATLERVSAEGGEVVDGPFEEPGVGRMAIIRDPVGGHVRVWHSEPPHGGELFNAPGALIWTELTTKEPEKAAAFYERVLGVTSQTMTDPAPYTTLNVGGRMVAGILKTTPEMGDFPPSWNVYFASSDVDATAKAAAKAGGAVLREPFDIPGVGRMAVIQDPQGAVFEVMSAPMGAD